MDSRELTPQDLNEQEENEVRQGQELYEMVKSSPGWQIIAKKLEDAAYHSWVDPREIDKPGGLSKEEWEWRELNGFHAANAAKEILEFVNQAVSRSEYLAKVKAGEIERKRMKI